MRKNSKQLAVEALAAQNAPPPVPKEPKQLPIGARGFTILLLGVIGAVSLSAWLIYQPVDRGFVEADAFLKQIQSRQFSDAYEMLGSAWKADEKLGKFASGLGETLEKLKATGDFRLQTSRESVASITGFTVRHTYSVKTPDGSAMVEVSLSWIGGRWLIEGLEIQSSRGYYRRHHD
jgi:hypothetical protein